MCGVGASNLPLCCPPTLGFGYLLRFFSGIHEMKRGRKPLSQPRRRLNVYIDEDLYAQFQLIYFDRRLGRAEFGAFSDLVNRFLKQHLKERQEKNA